MKLTDEQIAELAPDSCDYYCFKGGELFFHNCLGLDVHNSKGDRVSDDALDSGEWKKSKPIPRKPEPFDITQHEWSDEAKDCGISFRCPLWVMPDIEVNIKDVNGGDNTGVLIREHAIAIAKHFGLTAEDLK